ncbi:MAG: dihydropteroate synthase [Armatimonadota bacterium]|nr:dihydropteroate synthase [Armatimonadota bacterium]MDW8290008.1 dihydropteroate synthase [Armatimonadota bacterium]
MQAYAVPLNHIERLQQHLRERTVIMGILNVTPDSFYDGGRYNQLDAAVQRALQMVEEGADIIDIGGESTRPGSQPVSEEEELRRVLPVIEAVRQRVDVPISVDTTKSRVAERALQAGACMVNDISGLGFDPHMAETVARYGALCCIMHIQGTPQTMQQNPHYDDVVRDISRYFEQRLALAERAGIPRDRIWLDPGIGFGKTVQHNLEILRRLREFTVFGLPLLIGTSRKSFIGKILGDLPPEERLEGTAATIAIAIANGASAVRVHDVREMLRVARVTDAIVRRPLSD